VFWARAAAKRRQFRYPSALFNRAGQIQLVIAGGVFGYAKFMRIVTPFPRVQCNNMNFFSSSRKIFAPV
jgi:hypothetical protein